MPRRQPSTGKRPLQRPPSGPWKEGDILYLKPYDDRSEVYDDAGIAEGIPDHPVVLLHRPSSDSEYMVLALMTSLGGKTLETHWYTKANKKLRRRYVPIEPAPVNPDNGMQIKLEPHPCSKTSFINTSEILALPGKVLNRFGDTEGYNYSLNPESFQKLMKFVSPTSEFRRAKKIAKERDVERQTLLAITAAAQEVVNAELIPSPALQPPQEPQLPLFVDDEIPETSLLVGERITYASVIREPTIRGHNVPDQYNSHTNTSTSNTSRPVTTTPWSMSDRPIATTPMPGTYPDWTVPVHFPVQSAARSEGYYTASSLERGQAERQPLLQPADYRWSQEEEGGSSAGGGMFALVLVVVGVLYFTGAWSYLTTWLWS